MKFIRIPASKVLFLLYALMFLFIPDFALHEGKGFEIERPKTEDYAKPMEEPTEEDVREAKKKLERARKQEEYIAEEHERLREEELIAYDKVLGLEQAALAEGKEASGKKYQDAKTEYNKKFNARITADTALKEWKAVQESILKAFKTELATGYEPAYKELIEEPSWWSKVVTKVQTWITERRIDFNEFLGNQKKVIELRQDLAKLHTQLGREGLLPKARNQRELAAMFDDLGVRINKNLEALDHFIDAQERGELTATQKEEMNAEVKDLLIEMEELREQILKSQEEGKLTQEEKTILADMTEKIEEAYDALLTQKEKRELEKQYQEAKEAREAVREKVVNEAEKIISQMDALVKKNPLTFTEDPLFISLNNLEKQIDTMELSIEEEALARGSISRAYEMAWRGLLREINAYEPPKPKEGTSIAGDLVEKWMELGRDYGEKVKKYNEAFNKYLVSKARQATLQEKGPLPPLPKEYVQKTVEPLVGKAETVFKADRKEDFLKEINIIQKTISNINQSAVSDITLDARQAMVEQVLEPLLSTLMTSEKLVDEIYLKTVIELMGQRQNLIDQNAFDRSILTKIKDKKKPEFEAVAEITRQRPGEKQYLDQLTQEKKQIGDVKPTTVENQLLEKAHFAPLETKEIEIGKQFTEGLMQKTTSPVIPPQIPGD